LIIPSGARRSEKTIAGKDDIKVLFDVSTTLRYGKRIEDRYIHAYRFMVLTGMRPGELIALRNGDIKGSRVTISQSINYYNEITQCKTDRSRRTYTLTDHALRVIDDQKRMLMSLSQISPYIFPGEDLSHVKEQTLYNSWKKYCKANGINSATTPYELRHTFVSVNTDMPDALKKMVMGHSKNMDTHGIYGHEKADDMDMAAGYIDAAFGKILGL
jgi:integrase